MARQRMIRPEFFQHEELHDLEHKTGLPVRLAFIGLWTVCDRNGRFEWRPRRLKPNLLPFDDVDVDAILSALAGAGFIHKYTVDGKTYGQVPTFLKHQKPHVKEPASYPAPDKPGAKPVQEPGKTSASTGQEPGLPYTSPAESESESESESVCPEADPRHLTPKQLPYAEIAQELAYRFGNPRDCRNPDERTRLIAEKLRVNGGVVAADRLREVLTDEDRDLDEPTWEVWKRLGWEGGKKSRADTLPPNPTRDFGAELAAERRHERRDSGHSGPGPPHLRLAAG